MNMLKTILESLTSFLLTVLVAFIIGMLAGAMLISGGVQEDCRLMKQRRFGDVVMTCDYPVDHKKP